MGGGHHARTHPRGGGDARREAQLGERVEQTLDLRIARVVSSVHEVVHQLIPGCSIEPVSVVISGSSIPS